MDKHKNIMPPALDVAWEEWHLLVLKEKSHILADVVICQESNDKSNTTLMSVCLVQTNSQQVVTKAYKKKKNGFIYILLFTQHIFHRDMRVSYWF